MCVWTLISLSKKDFLQTYHWLYFYLKLQNLYKGPKIMFQKAYICWLIWMLKLKINKLEKSVKLTAISVLRFRKSRKHYSFTTRDRIIFKACLQVYKFKCECWTCTGVSAIGLCVHWVLRIGLKNKRLLTSQSVYTFLWWLLPGTQNRRILASAALVSSKSFPHTWTCMLLPEQYRASQVLCSSQH